MLAKGASLEEDNRIMEGSLKVATYNTFLLPHHIGRKHKRRFERVMEAINEERPDIICLQEVLWPHRRATRHELNRMGYNLAEEEGAQSGGLITASLRPINKAKWTPYKHQPNDISTLLCRKGGTHMLVDISDIDSEEPTLAVSNNHLAHRLNDTSIRVDQAAQSISAFHKGIKAIFAGDLNTSLRRSDGTHTDEIATILDAGFQDALVGEECDFLTYDLNNPHVSPLHNDLPKSTKVDHVFVRSGRNRLIPVATRLLGNKENPGSDHYGLVAEFKKVA